MKSEEYVGRGASDCQWRTGRIEISPFRSFAATVEMTGVLCAAVVWMTWVLLAFQSVNRFDSCPVFAHWAVPAHSLSFETALVTTVGRFVSDQRFSEASEYRQVFLGDTVGVIHVQID